MGEPFDVAAFRICTRLALTKFIVENHPNYDYVRWSNFLAGADIRIVYDYALRRYRVMMPAAAINDRDYGTILTWLLDSVRLFNDLLFTEDGALLPRFDFVFNVID